MSSTVTMPTMRLLGIEHRNGQQAVIADEPGDLLLVGLGE